jgi:membrane protein
MMTMMRAWLRRVVRAVHCFAMSCYDAVVQAVMHDGIEHAGYMAFLSLLAIFPFLFFVIAVAGFVGASEAGRAWLGKVLSDLPPHLVEALMPRLQEILTGPSQGLITVAIIGAIWTASSVIEGLRTIFNRLYRLESPPAYWWRRLLSIAQCLLIGFVLLASMVLGLLSQAWGSFWMQWPWLDSRIMEEFRLHGVWSMGMVWGLVAWIMMMVPNRRVRLGEVWMGSCLVVAGWIATGRLLTWYITKIPQLTLIYGGLGSLVASILYFYLIHLVLIIGVAFNVAWQKRVVPGRLRAHG